MFWGQRRYLHIEVGLDSHVGLRLREVAFGRVEFEGGRGGGVVVFE